MEKEKNCFLINSIIYKNSPITELKTYNQNNEFFNKLLEEINIFLDAKIMMQELDDYMGNNICEIVNYIRDNYKYINELEKTKKYSEYNEIIFTINRDYNDANVYCFYNDEIIKRGIYVDYGIKKDVFRLTDEIVDITRLSLSADKAYYDTLLEDTIPEETKQKLIMNSLFLYSVNNFYATGVDILNKNKLLKEVLIENKKNIEKLSYIFKSHSAYENTKSIKKYTKILLNEIRW